MMDHEWHGAGVFLPEAKVPVDLWMDDQEIRGYLGDELEAVNWYDEDGQLVATGAMVWRYAGVD